MLQYANMNEAMSFNIHKLYANFMIFLRGKFHTAMAHTRKPVFCNNAVSYDYRLILIYAKKKAGWGSRYSM